MSNSAEEYEDMSEKVVVELSCRFCDTRLTHRGMQANLLADTTVELFSTDCPKIGNVLLVGEVYTAAICSCNLSDVACIGCGNVVGYHVTKPCQNCLSSCHNGHFWMFLSESSYQSDKLDAFDSDNVMWEGLPDVCLGKQPKPGSIEEELLESFLR